MEIERRFLVNLVPSEFIMKRTELSHIKQMYLCTDFGKTTRIRICDDSAFLTVKGPKIKSAGIEVETAISIDAANKLFEHFSKNKFIEKVRHVIPYEDNIIELDIFQGRNKGLIIAEVEFKSVEDSQNFKPLPWFSREVTEDFRYSNNNLMEKPWPFPEGDEPLKPIEEEVPVGGWDSFYERMRSSNVADIAFREAFKDFQWPPPK